MERIFAAKLIEDRLGCGTDLIVAGQDGKSIRVFRAHNSAEFYRAGDVLMDAETGSEWNFSGCAVRGKLPEHCLPPVDALKDYWFDWRNYHPDTTIFKR